ncbi:MAG: aminoglycoside phosphotransferase family protein [Sinobacteraceae bacterium]|nr:aminoglycoside phosphotransferase family protein [Nevskiaceae bacterium]
MTGVAAPPRLNRIQRLSEGGCDIVRRHWVADVVAESLGADRLVELTAQRMAASSGLAPPVLAVDFEAGWMSMPFISGVQLGADWWHDESSAAPVLGLLEVLRALPAEQLPVVHLADRASSLQRRLAGLAPDVAQRWEQPLERCIREWGSEPGLAHRELDCFVHGDVSTDNLLCQGDGRLVLLDFEYAHRGHRLEDLAGLVVSGAVEPRRWMSWVPGQQHMLFATLVRTRTLLDGLWTDLARAMTGNAAAARAH